MASRMEKYREEETSKNIPSVSSRSDKNRSLYEDFYTNAKYTEFTDINDRVVVELNDQNKDLITRESYHKTKEFHDIIAPNIKKEEQIDIPIVKEEKIYDINQVLEMAKKNREIADELEKKRKMKATDYDILTDLNQEKLDYYKEQKKEALKADRDDLEELINTITSKSLRKEIDDDLMSDLLPSDSNETIINESLSKEILEKYNNDEMVQNEEIDEIDHSFYTKSMDLTNEDFDIQDTSFVEKKSNAKVIKIILMVLVVIIIAIICAIIYFI